MVDPVADSHASVRAGRAAWIGLIATLVLMAAALLVPLLSGWEVYPRAHPGPDDVTPLHGRWEPKFIGAGTVPAIVIAVLAWRYAAAWAKRLSWRNLMLASFVVALVWMLSLAFVDGSDGISRVLGNPYEYLPTARSITDVHETLQEFISRIPYAAAPDNWPTHIAGHPPGALLFFVGLVRIGLGGDFVAGMVVSVIAATTSVAVMTTLRALGREQLARVAAPFLVLTPAAVFMAVSADALFGAVGAWGLACLAIAATRTARRPMVLWSLLAGLLLGACVMLSYGLALLAILAMVVLLAARSWWPLPIAAAAALVVVLGFAVAGFSWWEAYPVLHDRYWNGVAKLRPASYWMWGNLAALAFSAGPLLGSGLARLAQLRQRADRVVLLLVSAAAATIAIADLSRMSKAEVERIWVPFIPWLTLSLVLLPERWRSRGLALQLVAALLVQQLLYTSW